MYKVPEYISTQYYKTPTNIRAYVCDERSNNFIILEKNVAQLWFLLLKSIENNKKISFKPKNKLFLHYLEKLGILQLEEKQNKNLYIDNSDENISESFSFEEDMRYWLFKKDFLPSLFIELTYNCNLKCIHCFNEKTIKNCFIDITKAKEIIDNAKKLGVFTITLSGGECTLNQDFLEICQYIRKKRISLEIFTNGHILYDNPKLLEELIKIYPHSISLSLYSINPEIHDSIVGVKNGHKKTLAIIQKLRDLKINVNVKCFLMKKNANEYNDIINFAKENNIRYQIDDNFIYNKKNNNIDVKITIEQQKKLYSNCEFSFLLENLNKKDTKKRKFLKGKPCAAGNCFLSITPQLDVYPCNNFENFKLGNLKNQTLSEIWHNRKNRNKLYKWQKIKKKHFKECFKFSYCKFCSFCPGKIEREGNLLKTSAILCENAQIKEQVFNAKK